MSIFSTARFHTGSRHTGSRHTGNRHTGSRRHTSTGYAIDVRWEPNPSQGQARVAGQVFDVSSKPTPVAAIPVLLVSDGKIVGRAMTCAFGEFRAEALSQDKMELYVMVDPGNCIQLPLEAESECSGRLDFATMMSLN